MTHKRPDGAAKNRRRTLTEADISSRRSTPKGPLVNSLGARGASASASVRGTASRREHDGAPPQDSGDKGGNAVKPGQDRD